MTLSTELAKIIADMRSKGLNVDAWEFQLAGMHVCYQCELFPNTCKSCGTYQNGWQPTDVEEVRAKVPEIAGYWRRLEEETMRRLKSDQK